MRINDMKYGFHSYQSQQNRSTINNTDRKSSPSAEIKISAKGLEISKALATGQAERQARIQELKAQIASGTYNVDSSKVADKLLGFWANEGE
jgi:negative regulator of flagellin synthesis FlgM